MINVMPVNDLKSAVALNMDARNVDTVMVAGKVVKRGGNLLRHDLGTLARRFYEARDRVYADANEPLMSPEHRLAREAELQD